MTRETLMAVAELAKKYDLLVVADDIYTAYSFGEPFIPMTCLLYTSLPEKEHGFYIRGILNELKMEAGIVRQPVFRQLFLRIADFRESFTCRMGI